MNQSVFAAANVRGILTPGAGTVEDSSKLNGKRTVGKAT